MASRNRWSRLAFLAPVLICLPCLLAPLAAVGGAAVLSTAGGALTGSLWLAAITLLLGGPVAVAVVIVRRRHARAAGACCPLDATPAAPSREERVIVRS